MSKPSVLLTGFEPFGGLPTNPTQDLVRQLASHPARWGRLHTAVLPVAYATAHTRISTLLAEHTPDIVLCTGLAAATTTLRFEHLAHNSITAAAADNTGEIRQCPSIRSDAPTAYRSTMPTARLSSTLTAAGVPLEHSQDAGGYLCNYVYFAALHTLAQHQSAAWCGFLHVPPAALLPLPRLRDAVQLVLDVLVAEWLQQNQKRGKLQPY